jgi:hypothetical protein
MGVTLAIMVLVVFTGKLLLVMQPLPVVDTQTVTVLLVLLQDPLPKLHRWVSEMQQNSRSLGSPKVA